MERVVIRAYEEVLHSGVYSEELLTNAPISGKSENKRGRHLLSFSAFNEFPKLAKWGIEHGADINLGDKDHANMLRMALGNYNIAMAQWALKSGANPNIKMGAGNDTMLSGLMKWNWPLSGFILAKEFKALPSTEKERQEVLFYLKKLPEIGLDQNADGGFWSWFFPGPSARQDVIDYIKSVPLITGEIPSAGSAELIAISMVDEIDGHLLAAMDSRELGEIDMDEFWVKGRGFEAFLTFNGFTKSVVKRLKTMDQAKAVKVVKTLDAEGNDLLAAAIKSLNDDVVKEVLKVSSDTVNSKVPDSPYHYSSGQLPLHMAIQWGAPYRVFELLVSHGANPKQVNSYGVSPHQLLEDYRKDWSSQSGKYEQVKSLLGNTVSPAAKPSTATKSGNKPSAPKSSKKSSEKLNKKPLVNQDKKTSAPKPAKKPPAKPGQKQKKKGSEMGKK